MNQQKVRDFFLYSRFSLIRYLFLNSELNIVILVFIYECDKHDNHDGIFSNSVLLLFIQANYYLLKSAKSSNRNSLKPIGCTSIYSVSCYLEGIISVVGDISLACADPVLPAWQTTFHETRIQKYLPSLLMILLNTPVD